MWFQQYRAPSHHTITIRKFLDGTFHNKWIERRGTIDWLAKLPGLSL